MKFLNIQFKFFKFVNNHYKLNPALEGNQEPKTKGRLKLWTQHD